MRVKLLLGNTFDTVAASIYGDLRLKLGSGHNVVIVPDKFSLSVESNLLKKLDITASFDIEVMSFTRFAAKTLKNKINRCLTPEGSVMLLKEAVDEVKDSLTVYKAAADKLGFPREIYAVVTSLRNSGIFPEGLLSAAESERNLKFRDVGLIYQKYLSLLENKLSDGSTRLQAFADYIPNIHGIENYNIFITDFAEFTAPQYDVIEKFIACAKSVTVGLVTAEEGANNARITPTRPLYKINAICKSLGVTPETTELHDNFPPHKKQILTNLFSYAKVAPQTVIDEVKLFSAPTVATEVEAIAKTIRMDVVEKGMRYKDFAVVVPEIDGYRTDVVNIFNRFEIPCFIDNDVLFSEQPAAKFILSAIRCAAGNYDYANVNALIKNPFFYENDEVYAAVERFENYCLENSLTGKLNKFVGVNEVGAVMNRVREIVAPFAAIKTATATTFADTLLQFVEKWNICEKCEEISENGTLPETKASAQIYSKFTAVIEEMKVTLQNSIMDVKTFAELLDGVFQNVKIALVPLYLDSVFVGEPDESRYDDIKVMFVAGTLDNMIPRAAANTAVIGISEEADLIHAGVDLFPTKKDTVKSNCFNLIHLLIKPKKQLIVSYPENYKGAEVKPSVLVGQLASLFSVRGENVCVTKVSDERLNDVKLTDKERARLYAYKFGTEKNGFYRVLADIACESAHPQNLSPYDAMTALLSADDRDKMDKLLMTDDGKKEKVKNELGLGGGTFSASQTECYFACPYKRYFQYGLRLKKRNEGALSTLQTGTLAHAVMQKFVEKEVYLNPTDEAIKSVIDQSFAEVLNSADFACFKNSKHNATFKRLKSECVGICRNIAAQITQSDFNPYISEAKIGDIANGAKFDGIKVTVDGRDYRLIGSIDRIDESQGYFTVIDYKSFAKGLSLKEIYNGTHIQPVLYMAAIGGDDKLKYPAGLLYQPISVGFKADSSDRFRMNGYVLDDPDVLMQLDTALSAGGRSEFFPVKLTAKGIPDKSKSKVLADTEFTALEVYTKKLVERAVAEIADGNVNPAPVDGACEFCDYQDICAYENDKTLIRKTFPKLSADDLLKLANGEEITEDEGGAENVE